MKITEVRIFQKDNADKKLKAFATITLDDCFVVRDIKIIERDKGLFVAMPSRRAKEPCQKCGHRNVVHSRYCNQCGGRLETAVDPLPMLGAKAHQGEHKDIAHPITLACREYMEKVILESYEKYLKADPERIGAAASPASQANR
ncbi:MAG: septation protein SpoVG family protein [Candidatus Omnitrophica bacterium]|nr:septation protein SpoVG family protein [Candidatus Omnitrophota bacterium]